MFKFISFIEERDFNDNDIGKIYNYYLHTFMIYNQ